jgi:hypothetical protein
VDIVKTTKGIQVNMTAEEQTEQKRRKRKENLDEFLDALEEKHILLEQQIVSEKSRNDLMESKFLTIEGKFTTLEKNLAKGVM